MKEKNEIPEFVRVAEVSAIYKGKGNKNDLTNDRGVFIVTILLLFWTEVCVTPKLEQEKERTSKTIYG